MEREQPTIVINPPEGFKNPGYPSNFFSFNPNKLEEYIFNEEIIKESPVSSEEEFSDFEKIENELNNLSVTPAEARQLRVGLQIGSLTFADLLNEEKRAQFLENIKTAIHEVAHAFLVKVGGGVTTLISIIRDGNTLGITKYFRGSNNPVDNIATSEAGGIGAQEFGFDPDGCGSDHAHSRYTAASHGDLGLISKGRQRARSAISGARSTIEQRAHYLYKKGAISGF